MRNYDETIRELYDLQQFSIKMGLDNIRVLCNFIRNPQSKYHSIHIAGTNGKGSTAIIMSHILSKHGLKCGLYTSPHLVDFRERIRVDNKCADSRLISEIWDRIAPKVKSLKATFFDTTTTIAFEYFYQEKVDVAIIETGLGGRLDSTNVLEPIAVIITPIDFDHEKQLSSNLDQITAEKAAIIKKGCTVFSANQHQEVELILRNHANDKAPIMFLSDMTDTKIKEAGLLQTKFDLRDKKREIQIEDISLNLAGKHQVENAALAYNCSRWYLDKSKIEISEAIFKSVLEKVEWPGRLQCVYRNPNLYLDVSHNVAGVRKTIEFLNAHFTTEHLHILFTILADKQYPEIIQMISSNFNSITVTELYHERALTKPVFAKEFAKYGKKINFIKDNESALEFSLKQLKKEDTLVAMGSHYLIGNLMKYLNKKNLTTV